MTGRSDYRWGSTMRLAAASDEVSPMGTRSMRGKELL